MKVSGGVVGKIPLGKLAWAVMEHMEQGVRRVDTYLGDRAARVYGRAHRRGREYGPPRHARAHATGPGSRLS